jgi:hypothetical protein
MSHNKGGRKKYLGLTSKSYCPALAHYIYSIVTSLSTPTSSSYKAPPDLETYDFIS